MEEEAGGKRVLVPSDSSRLLEGGQGKAIPSEASRMLEAALEQMDGIIQGAKYDLPHFDNFSIQECGYSAQTGAVREALKNLKRAILNSPNHTLSQADTDTGEFLYNWLKNNKADYSNNLQNTKTWWKQTDSSPGIHDLTGVEERMQELEREKDSLQLQVTILEDQIEGQSRKMIDLERSLKLRDEQCIRLEEALLKEKTINTGSDMKTGELKTEIAGLKLKCARLERDLTEYRNTTPKMPRPTNLSAAVAGAPSSGGRSPTPVSSPDDSSPVSRKGAAVPLSDDENLENGHDMDTSMVSLSGRSTRGIRKILGKIKRSNSGGFESDRAPSQAGTEPTFCRGGTRATASGRLGWSSGNGSIFKKKGFGEWSVDMLCTWLETIGLGQYTSEVQRHIGTGADLAKLGGTDLDTRLGIRNPLHRKKLILAMQAKIDVKRPDPAGGLDCAWVVRWLDDIGLPQYKESFLECRVDGRLLNLITVDDLTYLRVTSLLHHHSIRRGIQALRQHKFDTEFLKRRAITGDQDTDIVAWSNHRVMEWLRQVDLAEYAPNLRGSGVHGALIVLEPKFNADLLASLLSIPPAKSLLRRHLNLHFSGLIGKELVAEKRQVQAEPSHVPLTPTAKHKSRHGQFTLKRKKSKSELDGEDCLVCPLSPAINSKYKT